MNNENNTKNKELLLEISYKCNLNCIHCSSINCKGVIGIRDLPNYLYNIKEQRYYLDEIDVVRISGGEPTLVPNLIDYINFFYDRNVKVILQTNGTNKVDSKTLDKLDEIWISLYGSTPIHNFITMELKSTYEDCHSKVINSIKFLKEECNKKVVIQSPIFNNCQLVSVMNVVNELDFPDIKLRLFALLNQGKCQFALDIDIQKKIYHNNKYIYDNVELTCSLDDTKCNYENKLVLKPDGSLFNCASHKHGMTLCKK